jgi:hypothetical protein
MTTIWSLTSVNHPRKVLRQEEEGVDWVLETVGESAPRYRHLLLAGLVQLRLNATLPPAALSSSSGRPPS